MESVWFLEISDRLHKFYEVDDGNGYHEVIMGKKDIKKIVKLLTKNGKTL